MNQRNSNQGVGRLTGRSEVDAGIFRYRELLNQRHYTVERRNGSRLSRLFSFSSVQQRRAAGAAAATMLVLVLSFASASEISMGCLYLTPGTAGSGTAVSDIERAPSVSILAESAGIFELTAAGWSFARCIERYNGELCTGPYWFAP